MLPKFIMFKQYDCPKWNIVVIIIVNIIIVLDLHVGDLISLRKFQ